MFKTLIGLINMKKKKKVVKKPATLSNKLSDEQILREFYIKKEKIFKKD